MINFLQTYWDKLIVAAIAIYGAVLSTYTFRQNKQRDLRDQERAEREESAELTRVLLETTEMKKRLEFLDVWIWEKRVFTRKQEIMNALTAIKDFWGKNDATLRRFLGVDAKTYKALCGLYDVALQNLDNQPPPNGQGEWRGITNGNLLGYKVEQIFYYAEMELQKKRG